MKEKRMQFGDFTAHRYKRYQNDQPLKGVSKNPYLIITSNKKKAADSILY